MTQPAHQPPPQSNLVNPPDLVIQADNLHFRYADGTPALQGLSLSVAAGQTLFLFGGNGSGKTTLLLLLLGMLQDQGDCQGTLHVCGLSVESRNLAQIRRRVGLIFQDSDDQLFMPTVLEDVAFGLLQAGCPAPEAETKARHMLEQLGAAHLAGRPPYHLSAGEKKRVALASVLVMQPELLLLDEPTTALDPPAQRELLATLGRLPQAKLIVTHDVPFALALGGQAAFLSAGRVAALASVSAIADQFNWRL